MGGYGRAERVEQGSSLISEPLLEALSLVRFLERCVIDRNYKIPDAIAAPVVLSALGATIRADLVADARRIKPNDATLAVFLEFGCADGILADEATDTEALRKAIAREVVARRMLFPYIFGRELHDEAAKRFPEKTRLNNDDAVTLLRALPVGVFQEGPFVSGPFGLVRSREWRQLTPRRKVPGYYCSKQSCDEVHALELDTSSASSIARARHKLGERIKRKHSGTEDKNATLIDEAWKSATAHYGLYMSPSLFDLLSDGLSLTELQAVVDVLIRSCFGRDPQRRAELSKQTGTPINNPSEFATGLSAAQLLQVSLLHTDAELLAALDEASALRCIELTTYELRIPKFARFRGGAYEQRAELGRLGVRFSDSHDGQLTARRVLELLHETYFAGTALQAADLAYLLRQPESDEHELLGAALRRPIRSLLAEFILNNRASATAAAGWLGIDLSEGVEDPELLDRMIWKLGMPPPLQFAELQKARESINGVTAMIAMNSGDDEQRGALSVLFAQFEDVLRRALLYSAWALTSDHYLADQAFLYDPTASDEVLWLIEKYAPASDPGSRLDDGGSTRSTIVPLASAFARLAKALSTIDPATAVRPEEDYPMICRITGRPFAFRHSIPFFDLREGSRATLIDALKSVAAAASDEVLVRVRNTAVHGNNQFPSGAEITVALERLGGCCDTLEQHGLFPRFFDLTLSSQDGEGRSTIRYESCGDVVELVQPRWGIATKLISHAAKLLIMPTSLLTIGGPLRFSVQARSGRDEYWRGYPKRWKAEARYSSDTRADAKVVVADTAAG